MWIPHGIGEYTVDDQILYAGEFANGKMHGQGAYAFGNGDKYLGGFKWDQLWGIGIYEEGRAKGDGDNADDNNDDSDDDSKPPKIRRECIYYANRRLCFCDELLPGVRLSINNPKLHQSKGCTILSRLMINNKAAEAPPEEEGSVVDDTKQAKGDKRPLKAHYKVKLDSGGIQTLNLGEEQFQIDRQSPNVVLLEQFVDKPGVKGSTREGTREEKRYTFDNDSTSQKASEHKENWYSDKASPRVEDDGEAKRYAEEKAKRAKKWADKQLANQAAKDEVAKNIEINAAKAEKREEDNERLKEEERERLELQGKKQGLMEKRQAEKEEMAARRGGGGG
jgi:hypothetical protein